MLKMNKILLLALVCVGVSGAAWGAEKVEKGGLVNKPALAMMAKDDGTSLLKALETAQAKYIAGDKKTDVFGPWNNVLQALGNIFSENEVPAETIKKITTWQKDFEYEDLINFVEEQSAKLDAKAKTKVQCDSIVARLRNLQDAWNEAKDIKGETPEQREARLKKEAEEFNAAKAELEVAAKAAIDEGRGTPADKAALLKEFDNINKKDALLAKIAGWVKNLGDKVTKEAVYKALGLAAGDNLSKLDVAKINKLRGNDEFKSPLNADELDVISENIADLLNDKANTVENIVNAVKIQLNDLAAIHRN